MTPFFLRIFVADGDPDALQSSTESIETEFKSARGGMPGSFWDSYSAMANTQGVPDAAQLRTALRQATLAKAFSPVPSNQVQT
jgi:hypothetical protein